MNTNRICYTCGKKYYYCNDCNGHKTQPQWMNVVCGEECNDIFNACVQYNLGKLSRSNAQSILDKYDVKNKEYPRENVTNTIKRIYTKIRTKKPTETSVTNNEVNDPTTSNTSITDDTELTSM